MREPTDLFQAFENLPGQHGKSMFIAKDLDIAKREMQEVAQVPIDGWLSRGGFGDRTDVWITKPSREGSYYSLERVFLVT